MSNKTGADLSTIPRSQKILYISEEANSEETELMIDESAVTEGESYKVVVSQDRLEKPMLVDNIFYTSFNDLRLHLQQKKYDKIISHSVSNRVFQVLDGTDTSETDIICSLSVVSSVAKSCTNKSSCLSALVASSFNP